MKLLKKISVGSTMKANTKPLPAPNAGSQPSSTEAARSSPMKPSSRASARRGSATTTRQVLPKLPLSFL